MNCAWDSFISLLPLWMREKVDALGRDSLQELRLRIHMPPELVTANGTKLLTRNVCSEDLQFCINAASRYSPWLSSTASQGYITAAGGHRIGICGDAVTVNGNMTGIRSITSLCIRVARNFPHIAEKIPLLNQSVLIIGKPGSGKTTLLRSLIKRYSDVIPGSITVVDERCEVFPIVHGTSCFPSGRHTDIMSGCKKAKGIDIALRCMGPDVIAIDEITAEEDCDALLQAAWCGVKLFATAHAGCREDLFRRSVYSRIVHDNIFDTLLILQENKRWKMERMCP